MVHNKFIHTIRFTHGTWLSISFRFLATMGFNIMAIIIKIVTIIRGEKNFVDTKYFSPSFVLLNTNTSLAS
jgi:hypothetical protein